MASLCKPQLHCFEDSRDSCRSCSRCHTSGRLCGVSRWTKVWTRDSLLFVISNPQPNYDGSGHQTTGGLLHPVCVYLWVLSWVPVSPADIMTMFQNEADYKDPCRTLWLKCFILRFWFYVWPSPDSGHWEGDNDGDSRLNNSQQYQAVPFHQAESWISVEPSTSDWKYPSWLPADTSSDVLTNS